MTHSFEISHAEQYGVGEAIIIQNLIFWIKKNRANGKHYYDGRTWTYNSVKAFAELFPYYSNDQIRRIIEKLVKIGVLVKGNYSDRQSDRTTWFAFVDESAFLPNAFAESAKSHLAKLPAHLAELPNHYKEQILNTDNKPDNNMGSAERGQPSTKKRELMEKPTMEQAQEFATEAGGTRQDGEEFFHHFTSNGWKVGGRAPMKDWRAALRGWISRSKRYAPQKKKTAYEKYLESIGEAP